MNFQSIKPLVLFTAPPEAKRILSRIRFKRISLFNGHLYALPDNHKQKLYIGLTGTGKVQAGINTSRFVSKIKPDLIIKMGICGTLKNELKTGTYILLDNCYEADVPFAGKQINRITLYNMRTKTFKCDEQINKSIKKIQPDIITGTGITVDRFISCDDILLQKPLPLNPIAVDQEAAAIIKCAYFNQIPFASVFVVSDIVTKTDNSEKEILEYLPEAAGKLCSLFLKLFLQK